MPIYKCKFCETTVKTTRLLKRHIAEVHPKESGEVKQYLEAVDVKLESLSEVLPMENSSGNGISDSNESAPTPENHQLDYSDRANPPNL
jgi:hypothetical protein